MVLGLGVVSGAATALVLEARVPETRPTPRTARLGTPVLSVRRLPSVVAAPVAARRLTTDLDTWMEASPPASCLVVRSADGDITYATRGDVPLVPASTEKLLTATAVLLGLGPDTTFRTTAVAVAPASDGVVAGDLTLVGGGDPLLASPDYAARFRRQPQIFTDLDQLAVALHEAGVRRISGSVVGDESRYDRLRYVPGWPARYIDQDQTGPLSSLSVNDGFAVYPDRPGGGDVTPAGDPAANAAAVLTRLLEARGIDVVGDARSGAAPAEAVQLAAIESPPVGDVLTELLQESDNTTAELLLKELGAQAGAPSTAGGLDQLQALLTEAGVDLTGIAPADGSGLALDNRVSCGLLVDLLTRRDTGPALVGRLSVAGVSGTLADRFLGTPLQGHLRAKTGSLNTVSALAGVVEDEDGALTFAYLVNVPEPDRVAPGVVAGQQTLGEILLDWPRTPDLDALGPEPVVRAG